MNAQNIQAKMFFLVKTGVPNLQLSNQLIKFRLEKLHDI